MRGTSDIVYETYREHLKKRVRQMKSILKEDFEHVLKLIQLVDLKDNEPQAMKVIRQLNRSALEAGHENFYRIMTEISR